MSKEELDKRREIIAACLWMNSSGLNQGTSGNISVRHGDTMLISPSGVPYEQLEPDDIVAMPLEASTAATRGAANIPSSEWRFHLDIMRARPDVGAIVHAHSPYATTLAICRKEIPACHYMIAAAGGPNIRCATTPPTAPAELSTAALEALEDRTCCMLANHGMIATGPTSPRRCGWRSSSRPSPSSTTSRLCIGGPVLLRDAEIAHVKERFKSYGPRPKAANGGRPRRQE